MNDVDWKLLVDMAQVGSALVAFLGLLYTARIFRKQMNVQLFLVFTDRYVNILNGLSPECREARLKADVEPPPESPELRQQVLRYLNLCSEEFHLYRNGYLARVMWQLWEPKILQTLRSSLFRREWQYLKHEFDDHPVFQKYVQEIQSKP